CDTRKTNNGGCCVFPFIYLGKTYYDCTTKNLNNAWCATTANYDKNSDKWGQCDNSTPIFDEILQSNADKNEAKERAQYSVKLFQGDIVVDAGIQSFLNSRGLPGPGRTKRAVMRNDRQRWMINGKGVVPYVIESSNYHVRGVILRAIKHWESKVPCLKFVRYTRSSQGRYLSFFSGGGCYSLVGRQGNSGRQRISIGRGCGHMGVVAHEIDPPQECIEELIIVVPTGHALGFWHEQSRPDRDRYVTINWRNIQSGVAYNFHKYDTRKINSRGVSYDYNSVMHYSSTAFSRGRGLYTIVGKDGRTNLGQRYGLSAKDVIQANKLYCGSDPRPPTHRPPTHRPPTPPPPGCRYRDNHRWCPYWKSRGFCTGKHSGYMRQKCQKSCYCRQ
ncbi:hypothetical protein QZH41_016817, partial [Actinostola sp. cb2023]